MYRWYLFPDRLEKIIPTASNLCWLCSKSIGAHFTYLVAVLSRGIKDIGLQYLRYQMKF